MENKIAKTNEDLYEADIIQNDILENVDNNEIFDVDCPRCKEIQNQLKRIREKSPIINKNHAAKLCDHCKIKRFLNNPYYLNIDNNTQIKSKIQKYNNIKIYTKSKLRYDQNSLIESNIHADSSQTKIEHKQNMKSEKNVLSDFTATKENMHNKLFYNSSLGFYQHKRSRSVEITKFSDIIKSEKERGIITYSETNLPTKKKGRNDKIHFSDRNKKYEVTNDELYHKDKSHLQEKDIKINDKDKTYILKHLKSQETATIDQYKLYSSDCVILNPKKKVDLIKYNNIERCKSEQLFKKRTPNIADLKKKETKDYFTNEDMKLNKFHISDESVNEDLRSEILMSYYFPKEKQDKKASLYIDSEELVENIRELNKLSSRGKSLLNDEKKTYDDYAVTNKKNNANQSTKVIKVAKINKFDLTNDTQEKKVTNLKNDLKEQKQATDAKKVTDKIDYIKDIYEKDEIKLYETKKETTKDKSKKESVGIIKAKPTRNTENQEPNSISQKKDKISNKSDRIQKTNQTAVQSKKSVDTKINKPQATISQKRDKISNKADKSEKTNQLALQSKKSVDTTNDKPQGSTSQKKDKTSNKDDKSPKNNQMALQTKKTLDMIDNNKPQAIDKSGTIQEKVKSDNQKSSDTSKKEKNTGMVNKDVNKSREKSHDINKNAIKMIKKYVEDSAPAINATVRQDHDKTKESNLERKNIIGDNPVSSSKKSKEDKVLNPQLKDNTKVICKKQEFSGQQIESKMNNTLDKQTDSTKIKGKTHPLNNTKDLRDDKVQNLQSKENIKVKLKKQGFSDQQIELKINNTLGKQTDTIRPRNKGNTNKIDILKTQKSIENFRNVDMKRIKVRKQSNDDDIINLVKIKQKARRLSDLNVTPLQVEEHKKHKNKIIEDCVICKDSDLELDIESIDRNNNIVEKCGDIIVGNKILKRKQRMNIDLQKNKPMFFIKKHLDLSYNEESITKPSNEKQPSKEHIIVKQPQKNMPAEIKTGKGVIQYSLADKSFIEKGWTMLPKEKVVRKVNIYSMRPSHPEFDWFKNNEHREEITYDDGRELAEFDDNGGGRWFYRNGNIALHCYSAEELNAQKRIVVYDNEGDCIHQGKVLGIFDYLGNGVVYDQAGNIRLKYNQTEGAVLDSSLGPLSHWKWHTLNEPPVLRQVMIDTFLPQNESDIPIHGGQTQEKANPDKEQMLAIEYDNYLKEKSKKLSQKFQPFEIKTKAVKLNDYFSLKIFNQSSISLIFRDGATHIKLHLGMVLNDREIIGTETTEVGLVNASLEQQPARSQSVCALQKKIARTQKKHQRSIQKYMRVKRPLQVHASDKEFTCLSQPPMPVVNSESYFSTYEDYSSCYNWID